MDLANFFNIYGYILIAFLVMGVWQAYKPKETSYFIFIGAAILAFVAGFRGYLGTDTPVYIQHYYLQKYSGQNIGGFEKGYSFIEWVMARSGVPATMFFLIIAVISLLLLAIFLKNSTPYSMFALSYYLVRTFTARDMNQIRQALATSIVLLSIQYIQQKKLLKFSIIVLIASMFHVAALVMFVPYVLINYFNLDKGNFLKKIGILFGLSFVAMIAMRPLLVMIVKAIGRGGSYILGEKVGSLSAMIPLVGFQVGLSVLLIIYLKLYSESKGNIYIYVYLISTAMMISMFSFPTFASRLTNVLSVLEMIVFMDAIKLFSFKKKWLWIILVILFIFFMYYMNLVRDGYIWKVLPYGNPFGGIEPY